MSRATRKIVNVIMALLLAWTPLSFAGGAMHMADCQLASVSAMAEEGGGDPAAMVQSAAAQDACQDLGHDCAICMICFATGNGEGSAPIVTATPRPGAIDGLRASFVFPSFRPPISSLI